MKKLLIVEAVIACLFLCVIFHAAGIVPNGNMQNAKSTMGRSQKNSSLTVYPGIISNHLSLWNDSKEGEENIWKMCFTNLLKNGKKVNLENLCDNWKQKDEAARFCCQYDKKKKITTVIIKLNPLLRDCNGDRLDVRDLLFNYYVRMDPSCSERDSFQGMKIVGESEYYYGTKNIKKRKKEIKNELKKPSKETKENLRKEIVQKELMKEWQWVQSLYQDSTYKKICDKYKNPKDLYAYYYAYKTKYTSVKYSKKKVLTDILKQYGADYKRLQRVTGRNYQKKAEKIALSVILKKKGKDKIKTVSGIKREDNNTISIQIKQKEKMENICNIWLLPLKIYGEEKGFDGKKNFGLKKGSAYKIDEKLNQMFFGTGPYYSKKINDKEIILERNQKYWNKKSEIKTIKILRNKYQNQVQMIKDLLCNRVDLVQTSDGKELDNMLEEKCTKANYRIRKIADKNDQKASCILYRTAYVNAPSLEENITSCHNVFDKINYIKIN